MKYPHAPPPCKRAALVFLTAFVLKYAIKTRCEKAAAKKSAAFFSCAAAAIFAGFLQYRKGLFLPKRRREKSRKSWNVTGGFFHAHALARVPTAPARHRVLAVLLLRFLLLWDFRDVFTALRLCAWRTVIVLLLRCYCASAEPLCRCVSGCASFHPASDWRCCNAFCFRNAAGVQPLKRRNVLEK